MEPVLEMMEPYVGALLERLSVQFPSCSVLTCAQLAQLAAFSGQHYAPLLCDGALWPLHHSACSAPCALRHGLWTYLAVASGPQELHPKRVLVEPGGRVYVAHLRARVTPTGTQGGWDAGLRMLSSERPGLRLWSMVYDGPRVGFPRQANRNRTISTMQL